MIICHDEIAMDGLMIFLFPFMVSELIFPGDHFPRNCYDWCRGQIGGLNIYFSLIFEYQLLHSQNRRAVEKDLDLGGSRKVERNQGKGR